MLPQASNLLLKFISNGGVEESPEYYSAIIIISFELYILNVLYYYVNILLYPAATTLYGL